MEELTEDEIRLQLSRTISYIKNCEFDLSGMFPDNDAIKNKLIKLQEQKIELERKLEIFNDG